MKICTQNFCIEQLYFFFLQKLLNLYYQEWHLFWSPNIIYLFILGNKDIGTLILEVSAGFYLYFLFFSQRVRSQFSSQQDALKAAA